MAKRAEDEEVDFGAGAQLATDPNAFIQVVREAYRLEHECLQNQDIAEVLDVDKSRVTQIFKNPKALKAETIQNLLDPLQNERNRRRIIRAWNLECFGIDIDERPKGRRTGSKVSVKTIGRIDRYFREFRLNDAALTASEAANKAEDWVLKQQFLDRAYFAWQRLDRPDQAMATVRIMAQGAQKRGAVRRLVMAHLFRARILLGLANAMPRDIEPVLEIAERLLLDAPPVDSTIYPYMMGTDWRLAMVRFGVTLGFIERGVTPTCEEELRLMLNNALANITSIKQRHGKFDSHLIASRLYTLLGDHYHAIEHVEFAYSSGGLKNLNAMEKCGLVQARAMALVDSPAEVSRYYGEVIANCARCTDLYHRRMAISDRTRIESGMFPTPKFVE